MELDRVGEIPLGLRVHELRPNRVEPRFYFCVAVGALAFGGASVEGDLFAALIVDFAEDEFEQLPKRLIFLDALVAVDIVVAAAKGEEERIAGGGLELVKARAKALLPVQKKKAPRKTKQQEENAGAGKGKRRPRA